jgi:hypothetical protein
VGCAGVFTPELAVACVAGLVVVGKYLERGAASSAAGFEVAAGQFFGWRPLAHDADKIEMLIQAIEYQSLGADTRQWQENALAALRTDAGAELARAVASSSPQWWAAFNASYSELRASTRARKQLRKPVE